MSFCAVIEHTNAFDRPGYNGYKILYVSKYADHHDPVWEMDNKEIFENFLEGLKQINPRFSKKDVVQYFVFREKYAQPLPTIGHSKKIPPSKIGKKLYLVSNAQIYPEDRGVSDSIRLAKNFVETLTL